MLQISFRHKFLKMQKEQRARSAADRRQLLELRQRQRRKALLGHHQCSADKQDDQQMRKGDLSGSFIVNLLINSSLLKPHTIIMFIVGGVIRPRISKSSVFRRANEWDSLLFTIPQWLYLFMPPQTKSGGSIKRCTCPSVRPSPELVSAQ